MYWSRYTISCCRPLNLETISKKEAAITAICGNRHVKLLNVDNWTRFHRGDRFVPDNYSEIIAESACGDWSFKRWLSEGTLRLYNRGEGPSPGHLREY